MTVAPRHAAPGRATGPHYMARNHTEYTPRAVGFFDTEAEGAEPGTAGRQTLRCWHARFYIRREGTPGKPGMVTGEGTTVAELAAFIHKCSHGLKASEWYAHKLDYDLSLTRVTAELAGLGWDVTRTALGGDAPWLRMGRTGHVITFKDSLSFLRHGVAKVGAAIGLPKLDMPAWDGPLEDWLAYCRRDTEIIAEAVTALLDIWDRRHYGRWSLTGASTAFNQWRHKLPEKHMWTGVTPEQGEEDRRAIYGGWRQVARWGAIRDLPQVNYDFRSAYPQIGRCHPLPEGRQGTFPSLPVGHEYVDSPRFGILALVLVDTTRAAYPVKVAGRSIYPSGRFWTVLCAPEIAEARRRGELVAIGPGRIHRIGTLFAPYMEWVLSAIREDGHGATPVMRMYAKHAGRAVIGKMAQHDYPVLSSYEMPGVDWARDSIPAGPHNVARTVIVVNGQATESAELGDGFNAYPAVTAWVESWCRVYLAAALEAAGEGWATCWDTDGMWGPYTGRPHPDRLARAVRPMRMIEKDITHQMHVYSPQVIRKQDGDKMAGYPRNIKWQEDGTGIAHTVQGMPALADYSGEAGVDWTELKYGEPPYTIMGWLLDDGTVAPPECYIGSCGDNHFLPWEWTRAHAGGARLADTQSPKFLEVQRHMEPQQAGCARRLSGAKLREAPWQVCPHRGPVPGTAGRAAIGAGDGKS